MNEETRKKIQEKLNSLNNNDGDNNYKSNIWKIQSVTKGETEGPTSTVRLVNYPFTDDEDPFPELYFHYGIGTGPGILCPKYNASRDCPICKLVSDLYNGSEKDKEVAKKIKASNRYYAVVVDRADEELTPKYWGFGVTVYKELLGKLIDPDYGHFMELDKGIDISVKFVQSKGKTWPLTDITFRRKDTSLAPSKKENEAVLKSVKPIDEVFQPTAAADIKKRLSDWLSYSEEEAEANSGETVRGGNGSSEAANAALDDDTPTLRTDNVEDVEAAFAEALAD